MIGSFCVEGESNDAQNTCWTCLVINPSELFQSWLLERLRLSSTAHNNEQGQILSNIFHPMCALLAVLRRRAPQGVPDLPAGFYVFKMSPAGFHWSLSSSTPFRLYKERGKYCFPVSTIVSSSLSKHLVWLFSFPINCVSNHSGRLLLLFFFTSEDKQKLLTVRTTSWIIM